MILDNIRAYIEKTVLLLSQISKYITYFRRYNILSAPSCPAQQSKEMLKEEADLLQQHDRDLFGEKFSEHLVDSAKSKSRLSKYLLKRARKTKAISEYRFRGTEEEFWGTAFKIWSRRKIWEIKAKIFNGNYRPACAHKLEHN